ncbi:MAG: FliM/FliN family flagellar motor switch protein [Pirellulaceae bacterium]|nr:FliM/FliN family flagellar motor switch protein [Pirellulaceae bacterium]
MNSGKSTNLPTESVHAQNILSIETPLSVTVVRKTVTLSKVLGLSPGQVLRFDKRCSESLSLEAGGKPIASGKAVAVGDHLGIRLSDAS